ncbi:MAG: 3-hydroxyacyl-CoA dehydrogenase family protein [Blastocatellia bacterium]|nr:3-hydroxyacyl-CoA dehydrogenase family protein [Blastocatellia bacterium]
MTSFKTIGVLGAGTMGRGIAQVCAQQGYQVLWSDVSAKALETGFATIETGLKKLVDKGKLPPAAVSETMERITCTADLSTLGEADLVIEAVPEQLDLKQKLFAELDRITAGKAILATNTSSLSVSAVATATTRPELVIGLHFFNPVPVMKLLEIIRGEQTSDATLQQALAFGRSIKKDTIVVQDSPGFATSRLGLALGLEAIRMLESGVASAADIDRAMELGYNHPVGPLKLTDLVGLDVRLNIAEYLHAKLGSESFKPPALLRQMVAEGKLGKKSGRGFYEWNDK